MAVTVVLRGRLKLDPGVARQMQGQGGAALRDSARQAGDISHVLYLGAKDPNECLIVDSGSLPSSSKRSPEGAI
jgi:hypothetical protein